MKLHLARRRQPAGGKKRRLKIPLQAAYLTAICLLALSIGGAMYGIYRTVDRTLTVSEEVLRLQQEVTDETFKADDFLRSVELLEAKLRPAASIDWTAVANPFQSGPRATPPSPPPPPPGVGTP